ncbi:MAG: methyltransferase domain-containing protein [Deltaproteobacteria bacterium]|nr:methyltransferase domain-containing protein [Deltaproteobacteria bacterium]
MSEYGNDSTNEELERINRLQREVFDAMVDVFEPPYPPGVPERLKRIVAAGAIQPGETVLDVGSGPGTLIPMIRAQGPGRIIACDLSQKMMERNRTHNPDIEPHLSDVSTLDLPDGILDVVYINACFSNIADKASALDNVHRMMNSGGRLLISHPMGRAFVLDLIERAPFPLDPLPGKEEAEGLLAGHGFQLLSYVDEPLLFLVSALRTSGAAEQGTASND